jgi:hypothetical protein
MTRPYVWLWGIAHKGALLLGLQRAWFPLIATIA